MKILEAFKLASTLHAGQLDQAGRPYIEHLVRVFLRVSDAGGDLYQRIAALLHDSLEDGRATADLLRKAGVPEEAILLVVRLTKPPGVAYADYILSLVGDSRLILIKGADLDDNSDPQRLARLDPATASRLSKKYARAREILGLAPFACPSLHASLPDGVSAAVLARQLDEIALGVRYNEEALRLAASLALATPEDRLVLGRYLGGVPLIPSGSDSFALQGLASRLREAA